MLLINQKQLELNALDNDQHPMHHYAVEYKKGVKNLIETYGNEIKFVRPGYPRKGRGIDPRGDEVDNLKLPTAPLMIPLQARVNTTGGMEIWAYTASQPKLLPNGLWEPTGKRSKMVEESFTVSMKKEPELAFFLYYKSPFLGSEIKIDDPTAEAREEDRKAREELDLQTALYSVLNDDDQLKVIAQAYGVSGTDKKHPAVIRKELKGIVLAGNIRKRSDPTAKGVEEFLQEVKGNDSVRLRSLLMVMEDKGKIKYSGDGRYRVGERELCRVPVNELGRKKDFLSNHLSMVSNRTKLQELLRDVVDISYLDGITDERTFTWLARVMQLPVEFKPKEFVKEKVYECFIDGWTPEEVKEPEVADTNTGGDEAKKATTKKK